MIDINKVVAELSAKRLEFDSLKTTKGATRLKGQISFLHTACQYLKTFPNEEFVKSQLGRLNKRLKLIEADFEKWIPNKQYPEDLKGDRKKFADYQKEMDVPKVKLQIRALRYISND